MAARYAPGRDRRGSPGNRRQVLRRKRFSPLLRRLGLELLEDRRLLSMIPFSVPSVPIDPPGGLIDGSPVNKETIIVSTAADESDGDYGPGDLSLREALLLAAGQAGDDVIQFDESLAGGTIDFHADFGQLEIDSNVDIQGLGAEQLTVDASYDDFARRAFYVAEGVTASISGLRITGAQISDGFGTGIYNDGTLTLADSTIDRSYCWNTGVGGGIYNQGTLTLINSTIHHCAGLGDGGAIYNAGTMTITGGLISESWTYGHGGGIHNVGTAEITGTLIADNHDARFGGGIFNTGQMTLTDAMIRDNEAWGPEGHGSAGGIYNSGTLSVANTTVSGNQAAGPGGGFYNVGTLSLAGATVSENEAWADGGGIYNAGPLTLSNATISANSSCDYGGAIYNAGTLAVTAATICDNSSCDYSGGIGGVYNDSGTALLHNTIVARNVSRDRTPGDVLGTFDTASSRNLIGAIDGSTGLDGAGTLYGTAAFPLDPRVGPLGDYGGTTLTHAVWPSSPVIDAGSNDRALEAGLTHDQRGLERFVDGDSDGTATVDVGACEFDFDRTPPAATLVSAPDVIAFGGTTQTIQVEYSDDLAIDVSGFDDFDVRVIGPDGYDELGHFVAIDNPSDGSPRTATYQIPSAGVTWDRSDNGTYEVRLQPDQAADLGGNFAPAGLLGTFAVTIEDDVPSPVPLQPEDPLGSLIYTRLVSGGVFAPPEDTDSFTVELDEAETLTVVVHPDPTLQPTIELLDPNQVSMGTAAAGAAGEDVILQAVPTNGVGTYTVTLGGAYGTTGACTVRLIRNAAAEQEGHPGPANDTPASAQDLGASFIAPGDGLAQRGAVLGTLDSSEDWYRFTLDDGQSSSLVLTALPRGSVSLELYHGGANRLAMAAGTLNANAVIDNFVDRTSDGGPDTYFARITGQIATDYRLVITRDADFDVEPNGRPGMAQDLAGTGSVLGHLGRPSPASSDDGQPAVHEPARVGRVEPVGRVEQRGPAGNQADQAVDQEQAGPRCSTRPTYAAGRLIVRFAEGVTKSGRAKALAALGGKIVRSLPLIDGVVVELSDGKLDAAAAAAAWSAHPAVLYAEPDYLVHAADTLPDDPSFAELWGMHNTGQTGGTADADVDAPEAWDLFTGSRSVVVASIDTGVDYNHEDLAANMWTNPGEVPGDGLDNDGNGYVDDVYGINACYDTSDPRDDAGHGTHTSGTIGAVGNNGVGVAGVNWNVRIMALKFLNSGGSGSTSDAIECVQYMTMMKTTYGVNVVASNNSWGGGGFSQALKDAIEASNDAGILFVASAGNDGVDTDGWTYYPCDFDLDGIISVAASDHDDQLASFSNYGATTVDLAAPGVDVLSTLPENGYGVYSGTSMAAPHVAGAVALLAAYQPSATSLQIKEAILESVDPVADFAHTTLAGGRLNLAGALHVMDDANDYYRVAVEAGDTLVLGTTTPGDGVSQLAGQLDPALELYDPEGTLVAADDNSAADGRNALLTYEATATGTHTVRVLADVEHGGEYLLNVSGHSGALPAFQVAAMDPADGAPVQGSEPVQITLDFNDAVLLSSLEASDLTIGGVPAASVSAVDANKLTFEFSVGLNPGANQVAMAAGAVVDLQGTPIEPFTGTLWVFQGPIMVSTLADDIDGDYSPGELSLREALALAADMPGEDVIRFDSSLHGGTILRAPYPAYSRFLHIDSDVVIEGPGAGLLRVDGNDNEPVFCIPPGVEATIRGLTIAGGFAHEYSYVTDAEGAGICNLGNLTVADTTICHNWSDGSGGGIYNGGQLTLTGSTIFDNVGGALTSWGTLTIDHTTISGGSVNWDGGLTIYSGVVAIANTTICSLEGTGVYVGNGTVTITNTTISGNSFGGISVWGGTVTLVNSTITGNSSDYQAGGVFVYPEFAGAALYNTIVADNHVTDGSDSHDVYGAFDPASSHSLIGVIDGSTGLDGSGTLFGTAADPLDPRLGPLGDHGGATWTMPLLSDSPAVDAGDPDVVDPPPTDQRGSPRIVDGDEDGTARIDMGAFEYVPGEALVFGRHVFYNASSFDGEDPAANEDDDAAIAPDKVALLPGQTASFANYTSYTCGLNGIMVDVDQLAGTPTVDDFQFKVGNDDDPAGWTAVTATPDITVRPGDGVDGADRVTIIWPDSAVQKQWLQVTVLATANTGLVEPDVFYFGNAVGESGNSTTDAKVNAADMLAARNNQRTFIDPAPVDFLYDYNRDARVNATDMLTARNNRTDFLNALRLITVPGEEAGAAERSTEQPVSAVRRDWLYEFEPAERSQRSATMGLPAAAAVDLLLTAVGSD